MRKNTSWLWYILIIAVLTAGIAAAAARWTEGEFWMTFRLAAGLSLPFLILSVLAWNWGGRGKTLAPGCGSLGDRE